AGVRVVAGLDGVEDARPKVGLEQPGDELEALRQPRRGVAVAVVAIGQPGELVRRGVGVYGLAADEREQVVRGLGLRGPLTPTPLPCGGGGKKGRVGGPYFLHAGERPPRAG